MCAYRGMPQGARCACIWFTPATGAGLTNAKIRRQQGNGPDGYDCDLNHEDLEQEVSR